MGVFQVESSQLPSMMEKQMKTSKAKAEKSLKGAAESPAPESGPGPAPPAQTLQGGSYTHILEAGLLFLVSSRLVCFHTSDGQMKLHEAS